MARSRLVMPISKILILTLVVFLLSFPVCAEIYYFDFDTEQLGHHGVKVEPEKFHSESESLLNNSKTREFYENNKPSYGERFTAGIIISFVNWVVNLFHLSDPILLVFGKDPRIDDTDDFLAGGLYGTNPKDDLILGVFLEPFFNAVTILYTAFERLLPIPYSIALVFLAILIMLNSSTAEGRSKQKDYFKGFIVAFVVLRFGHYLWVWIVEINNFLVDLIWAYMMNNGVVGGFFMDMIWGTGRGGFDETAQIGSLALAVILLLAAIMCLVLNYQYTVRMIILGALILLFPIAATMSVFPAYRHSLTTWFQEFTANTFIQLAHAIALGGFFLTLAMPGIGQGAGFWIAIAYFAGMPAIVNLVRQLLGLESKGSAYGLLGATIGMAAVAGMIKMFKSKGGGAFAGVSADTDIGGLSGNIPGMSGGSSFKGLDNATSMPGKIAQGIYNTAGKIATSPITKTAARVGIGGAAALTGSVLTTMATGNPAAGILVGTTAGMGISNLGGKITGSLGEGLHSALQGGSFIAPSMAKGGFLFKAANVGWGLESAINKIGSAMGIDKPFVGAEEAVTYISQNRQGYEDAVSAMNKIKPEYDAATAEFEAMKSKYGKGTQWFKENFDPEKGTAEMPKEYRDAQVNYNKYRAEYETHKANALRCQNNLRNYEKLKEYVSKNLRDDTAYSSTRGMI